MKANNIKELGEWVSDNIDKKDQTRMFDVMYDILNKQGYVTLPKIN